MAEGASNPPAVAGSGISTEIASNDRHHIWVRGLDLTADVMGQLTFSEVVFLLIQGRTPDPQERRLLDAILVSLVEHGLTPSAMVARINYSVAPESIQGAVASGLVGVGSLVLGSMEECGRLLMRIDAEVRAGTPRAEAARQVAEEYRQAGKRLPGIGHQVHTEGDPRATRLFEIAEECGKHGRYVGALEELVREAESLSGRRLPLNVTGAVAAVLLELGVPWQLHRGFALISRSAGLVAHIGEEMQAPITPALRKLAREPGPNGAAQPKRPA
jgi:citrate synthase